MGSGYNYFHREYFLLFPKLRSALPRSLGKNPLKEMSGIPQRKMAPSVSVGEITPVLGQWMTNQVLQRDKSILSAMLVDSGGIVLGHESRDDPLGIPRGTAEVPVALPILGGKMMLFLRVSSRRLADMDLARFSEFISFGAEGIDR